MSGPVAVGRVIYFAGSIRGGRDDAELYARIVQQLSSYGQVLTEHVASPSLTDRGEAKDDERFIHDRDMAWLSQADVIVAEVTQPSLGVGYELGRAKMMGKRVLCLFRPASGRSLSAMIRGAADGEKFIVRDYEEKDVPAILKSFFDSTQP